MLADSIECTVQQLAEALLKTEGRYDSKQDQAEAIKKITDAQRLKLADTPTLADYYI